MEYDVVFPSIFVNSVKLVFNEGGSSFATCCFATCWDCFFSFDGIFLLLLLIVCLSEEKFFLISGIRRRCGHLDGCCLNVFLDFEIYLLCDFEFQSGEKVKGSVDWTGEVCFLELELQHIVTCIPQCWWNCFQSEESCDWFFICQKVCWLCCFPQNACKLKKCHLYCQEFSRADGPLGLRRGDGFRFKRHGDVRFAFRLFFSDLDHLQTREHNHRLWSLHLSLRRVASLECVVSMLSRKHHCAFC